MFSLLRKILKMSVPVALALVLPGASFAQLSLRTALDYDGDNKADTAIFRPSNNTFYFNLSNGGFSQTTFGLANSDTPCPGDYDGDGKGDICVWRDTDGVFYTILSSTNTFYAQQWGVTGDEPIARRWDGDNKTDFAVVRRTGGQLVWYILQSTNGALNARQYGVASDFVIPGDYDGDGKFDFAVQRPGATASANATIFINNSSVADQSSNNANTAFAWGFASDLMAPGDYNGDGRTDICAVRDNGSNYVWFIRNTVPVGSTVEPTVQIENWGIPSVDFLAQADYDGDGKTDVAVWRDTDSIFYIFGSRGTIQYVRWGVPSDYPLAAYDTH